MGSLFILNDSEQNIYWKKNIFKIERFIMYESIIMFILSFIACLTFPFDSFNLVKQKIPIKSIVISIVFCSLISYLFSLLIKKVHIKNNIKPNYRLCLMNFYGHIGLFCFLICFILSLYTSLLMIEWEGITGIITYRTLVSGKKSKKIVISIGKAIYTLIWNHFILIVSILGLVDYVMEIAIISRAAKYLSTGNNINNQILLHELFRIPIIDKSIKNPNYFDNLKNIDKKENIIKLRLIMSNKNNEENCFENEDNKFREVEIIQKIEYKSIGVQTHEDDTKNNNTYYNNYINNDELIDEDLSNNLILIKNRSLIDSKTSLNEVMTQPIK